jgi:Putative auto-transporter adhesin, head GIN domain
MAHKLAIVAVIGLTASAVCMGAAAGLGGGNFGDGLDGLFGDGPRCHAVAGAIATSRDLDWDGSDKVQLVAYSDASYTPSADLKLHASGDPQVLAHLRIQDGKIDLDCRGWRDRDKIRLTLPGREFREFAIAGRSDLTLDRMNQSSLKAKIAGTGTIHANGRIDDLKIEVAGIGHADFGKVAGRSAKVKLAGVASADIAPSESAKIEIAGPSTVNLYSNPKDLDTNIAGPGSLHKLGPNG